MIRVMCLLIMFTVLHTSQAIMIRHDVDDTEYQVLSGEFNGVVTFRNNRGGVAGMGTLIADRWVLTAAHLADGLNKGEVGYVGDESITIERVVYHPKWAGKVNKFNYDIALVKVSEPSSEIKRAALYTNDDELGKTVLFIGRGDTGNGKDGKFAVTDIMRGANNIVSEVNDHVIKFVFNPPGSALPLEGISGPGDSGGPALIYNSGQYQVAGVSSTQNAKPTGGIQGTYGVIENYIRVSKYRLWIESVMEE